ncbi:MAG: hypothetical protein IPH60_15165 [Flavobacteriales bacterium]|nr:hypothetical protein [Flavobacteriales bacterium]
MTDLDDDGKHLWICTNDGLVQFDRAALRIVRHYSVHDGLPDQFLYGMEPTGDGTWWISSNNGLCPFRSANRKLPQLQHGGWPAEQGEYNSFAQFRSASGRLYFGGVNGFNVFDPRNLPTDPDPATVRAVELSDAQGAVLIATGEGPTEVELPYPRNTLRIELAVLEFSAPERNRYKWRMPGYREAWTTARSSAPIELNNVPAGPSHRRSSASTAMVWKGR